MDRPHDAPVPHETSLATWLRAVLSASFVVPTVAFVLAMLWGYDRARTQAEATVDHASALALRHAQRTFEIALTIAERADQVSAGTTDWVRMHEADIHQRLSDISAGLPSVVNLNIWDENGLALARSDQYPVNKQTSVADRTYFIERRASAMPLAVSEVLTGRQSGREIVNAAIRRHASGAVFSGVVAVSLSPEFFRDYYSSLASEQPNLASFALIRTDGTIIARWPKLTDGRTRVDDDNPTLAKVTAGIDQGTHGPATARYARVAAGQLSARSGLAAVRRRGRQPGGDLVGLDPLRRTAERDLHPDDGGPRVRLAGGAAEDAPRAGHGRGDARRDPSALARGAGDAGDAEARSAVATDRRRRARLQQPADDRQQQPAPVPAARSGRDAVATSRSHRRAVTSGVRADSSVALVLPQAGAESRRRSRCSSGCPRPRA